MTTLFAAHAGVMCRRRGGQIRRGPFAPETAAQGVFGRGRGPAKEHFL